MMVIRSSITQQAPPSPSVVNGEQLGEQIRQSVLDATAAARDARQQIRDAQQQVRDAEQQLRAARTADQRGAAEQSLAAARAALAEAQAGSRIMIHTSQPSIPMDMRNVIPPQAVDIAIAFFIMVAVMVVGWPISRALGRRIERRGQIATLDAGTIEQLQRIEQAVDAMSIEIERISESQRFMARLQRDSAGQQLPGIGSH